MYRFLMELKLQFSLLYLQQQKPLMFLETECGSMSGRMNLIMDIYGDLKNDIIDG